jgi:hypothetical protein
MCDGRPSAREMNSERPQLGGPKSAAAERISRAIASVGTSARSPSQHALHALVQDAVHTCSSARLTD